jgi:hypothetical protein
MKSIIHLLGAFALLLAMFSQPTGASAADVFHLRSHGVDGAFSNLDPSGCIYTGVDLVATEQVSQTSAGAGEPSAGIFVHLFQADFCNNTVIHTASATEPLSESELEFTGRLNSATLQTTVSMFDFGSTTPFDLTLDLTWTVSESRRGDNFNSHFNFEGCHFIYRNISAFRLAELSGSVSYETTTLTPEPSQVAGRIFTANHGTVSHGCG